MKKIIFVSIIFFLSCNNSRKEKSSKQNITETTQLEWLQNWMAAWELVATDILKLPPSIAPQILFYDETYVYTTSDISAPNGEKINGPEFFGKKLKWKKGAYNDTLILPDGKRHPVQLMSFAGPLENSASFFVMAAPEFWKKAGVESKEVGLDNMLTGVFLHEFSHTQQVNGFGSKITELEKNHSFKFEVNDDLIQSYFSNDSLYAKQFNEEVELFYAAATAKNIEEVKKNAKLGLKLLKIRQSKYLKPEKEVLIEMDDIFLTMEGLGQYMIVAWLMHPEGGNISLDTAIRAVRRSKKWWSQDEGLALFLVLKRLTEPDWANDMFGNDPGTIIELLEKELK